MAEDQLQELLTTRRIQKGKLDRINHFVNGLVVGQIYHPSAFSRRLDNLDAIFTDLTVTLDDIERISDDQAYMEERATLENYYYDIRDRLLGNQERFHCREPSPTPSVLSDRVSYRHNPEIRLPVLTLPSFDGKIEEWYNFKNVFQAVLAEYGTMSDVHKFFYLRGALKGPAASVIQALPSTGETYKLAWELLEKRYANKRHIVETHNLNLIHLQQVASPTAETLRKILDTTLSNVRALQSLGETGGEALIVTLILQKLDNETKREWRFHSTTTKVPTFQEFVEFMEKRIQSLNVPKPNTKEQRAPNPVKVHVGTGEKIRTCPLCKSDTHGIYQCSTFKNLSVSERRDKVKTLQLCFNCMGTKHSAQKCLSKIKCQVCKRSHHTMLHLDDTGTNGTTGTTTTASTNETPVSATTTLSTNVQGHQVLLSTAQVYLVDRYGKKRLCRCLLDSGSQTSFITANMAKKLKLPQSKSHLNLTGISAATSVSKRKTVATLHSKHGKFSTKLTFHILDRITTHIPSFPINISALNISDSLPLADETFHIPSEVDALIGAEIYLQLLEPGSIAATNNRPFLQCSKLGWIVGGPVPCTSQVSTTIVSLSLSEQVERFWKLEECKPASTFSKEEQDCETHFTQTYKRNNGRYEVSLPFKQDPSCLGRSRSLARSQFFSLERRLQKHSELKEEYCKFMEEYEKLGHMKCLGTEDEVIESNTHYYLPHHCVLKDSTTTKVRVVFNASMKTTSGLSLNDVLMVGPTIQDDLFTILTRFRKHNYVIVGDINKMYRCIRVNENDTDKQLIFWRPNTLEPLRVWKLLTVTYGTGPAPFQATRCLKQLAIDESKNFPLAAKVMNDFSVDDIVTGGETLERTKHIRNELIAMLGTAGFHLRKWVSNNEHLLEGLPPEDLEKPKTLDFSGEQAVHTLGLVWVPKGDQLQYVNKNGNTSVIANTKRKILSHIAAIFDPLGLIGPIVCRAKIFFQELWRLNLTWDEVLPNQILQRWTDIQNDLKTINTVKIDRCVTQGNNMELHGFADASEVAYGCCIYVKTVNNTGEMTIKLLCAKSRVAPQKQVTLPRLELCAALLLTQLITKVKTALRNNALPVTAWSDSKTALSWISAPSYTWKTFVANRVAEIQSAELTWKHIAGNENPADIISRGTTVEQLNKSQLWWNGPELLHQQTLQEYNTELLPLLNIPEKRKEQRVCTTVQTIEPHFISRFSNINKLIRIIGWILRFTNNCNKNNPRNSDSVLTVTETTKALHTVLKISQKETFSKEIADLTNKRKISKKSKLISLNPFLDNDGVLRVGGRLSQAHLEQVDPCPIILPPKHHITKLIIKDEHLRCLHGGVQLTMATIRQKYWPINAKNETKKIIFNCVRCFRAKPKNTIPLMGNIPDVRIEPARPFLNSGVDFAGPFFIKPPTRSNIKLKSYVAVFVCMATKAVHLELVGSLHTDAFLAALKRFTGRRGLCKTLYSDNATNFVGAKNQLKELYEKLRENEHVIKTTLITQGINWKFIPPNSPHFGGLWEAAVKSMKTHLKRIAGEASLTYEEFNTLLTNIEACLNSRPITPLSNDPADMEPLTPGHFLIGEPILSIPEPDTTGQNINRLIRWDRITALKQHFWKRWSTEYITSLHPRTKWRGNDPQNFLDKLVIIKEDNLPPLQWKLGRIIKIHKGKDNIIRVATLKTQTGEVTRSVTKLFPLPLDE